MNIMQELADGKLNPVQKYAFSVLSGEFKAKKNVPYSAYDMFQVMDVIEWIKEHVDDEELNARIKSLDGVSIEWTFFVKHLDVIKKHYKNDDTIGLDKFINENGLYTF